MSVGASLDWLLSPLDTPLGSEGSHGEQEGGCQRVVGHLMSQTQHDWDPRGPAASKKWTWDHSLGSRQSRKQTEQILCL